MIKSYENFRFFLKKNELFLKFVIFVVNAFYVIQ